MVSLGILRSLRAASKPPSPSAKTDRAGRVGSAEEIRCIERGGVKVAAVQTVNAQVSHANDQIVRRRCGIIRQEYEWNAGGRERLHKLGAPGIK